MTWGLSPEAAKAQHDAAVRDRLWAMRLSPRLARTADKAVILRPRLGGRKRQAAWAQWIRHHLPQFRFNSRLNRWEAPLSELRVAREALPEAAAVSEGAAAWLEVN